MRITRNQLQALINEEISRSLLKSQNRRLIESYGAGMGGGAIYDIDSAELIAFADAYVSLGSAVQEQLVILLDEQEGADINPNAVELMRDTLGGQNSEIDAAIEAWSDQNGEAGPGGGMPPR